MGSAHDPRAAAAAAARARGAHGMARAGCSQGLAVISGKAPGQPRHTLEVLPRIHPHPESWRNPCRTCLISPSRERNLKWKRRNGKGGGDTNSALSKSKTVIATRENSGMRTKKLKLGVPNVNPRKTKNPRNGGYQDGANQWRRHGSLGIV